jgi:Ca2+-binding RTX toxin-like protein
MLTITYSIAGGTLTTLSFPETTPPAEQRGLIQSALDAVASGGGGTVSLSSGTFTIIGTGTAADGALRVGSNTTFEGAGMGETVLKMADGATTTTGIVRTDSGQTLADGSIKTTSNVLIRNMTIDGNKSNTSGDIDGLYTGGRPHEGAYDSAITVDSVEIMNVSRYGFDPHEGTVGLTITNSVAHHNGVDGFTIDGSTDVVLANNTSYANGRHGFNIVTGTTNVTMTDNVATNNAGSGITLQTGDNEVRAWTSGITITGGTLSGNGRHGLEVRQVSDVDISGVTITDNVRQGVSLLGVSDVTLSGNRITSNSGGVLKLDGYLQDFGDTDPANDRYVVTSGVTLDGAALTPPAPPAGVTEYTYVVTAGDDTITGSAGRDAIDGGRGNDVIAGHAGNDTLYGNAGNDRLAGGLGDDVLYGNDGADTLAYDAGFDRLDGGAGYDTIDFSAFSSAVRVDLAITSGANAFTSGTSAATPTTALTTIADLDRAEALVGSAFADHLAGDGGANTISGGAGSDAILGGAGDDGLTGGLGNDTLTGGTGNDRFIFDAAWGRDTIKDFTRGKDRLFFEDSSGVNGFSDLSIRSSGRNNTIVTHGGDEIVLEGIKASTLTAADFVFV